MSNISATGSNLDSCFYKNSKSLSICFPSIFARSTSFKYDNLLAFLVTSCCYLVEAIILLPIPLLPLIFFLAFLSFFLISSIWRSYSSFSSLAITSGAASSIWPIVSTYILIVAGSSFSRRPWTNFSFLYVFVSNGFAS